MRALFGGGHGLILTSPGKQTITAIEVRAAVTRLALVRALGVAINDARR
jgi:hypothetical protein